MDGPDSPAYSVHVAGATHPITRLLQGIPGRALAFGVLVLSLATTLIAFEFARRDAAQQFDQRFAFAAKEISDDIRERLVFIEESLHASRAFVLAAKSINRDEWRIFQNNQEMENYHPGTFGIGLAPEIRSTAADAYMRAIRQQDRSDYRIWPSGERAVYAPIRFTASHNGDTRALGLDMYSEPRRRDAMERARDTGKPSLSGVVTLVKAGDKEARESIILFLPIYKRALAPDASVEQRRAAFVSYVYCPILIAEFWEDVVAKASRRNVALQITDAEGTAILPMVRGMPAADEALTLKSDKDVYGRRWNFEFRSLAGFADTGLRNRAAIVAVAGLAISFLLFGIVWVQATTRLRAEAIARNMTRALRESEGRLRRAVEQSPDAMIIHQDGKIVFVNQAMVRLMRVADSAALIGQPALAVVHPLKRKLAEQRMQELYVKKTLPLSELVYIRADGTAVEVEVAAVSVELEAQAAALVTVRDISERKKQEAENERLRRLYTALSQINQAIVWMPGRDQLFQRICEILVEHGGFRLAWIGWHAPASARLIPVAQSGDDGSYLEGVAIYTDDRPEGNGPAGRAFREGKPYICRDFLDDPSTLPWRAQAQRRGFRAAAVFPIRLKGEVRGTLAVYATNTESFEEKEISLLAEAATDVSFALDNFAREEERRRTDVTIKRLAAIVESTDDVIIAKDLQGIITDWNPSAERVFGYTAAEIIGRPIRVLIPPDRAGEEEQILARIGKGEQVRHFETVRMRKDGQTFPVSVTISPIWGPDDTIPGATKIVGASKIVRDITERIRSEKQLRDSEANLRNAQRIARIGSWELNLITNKLHWSDQIFDIFGIEKTVFAASFEAFVERIHPEDRERFESAQRVALTGQARLDIEHRIVLPDGTEKIVHELGYLTGNETGQQLSLTGTVHDITERKRAEARAQTERLFSDAMIDSMPGILYLYDERRGFLRWNRSFAAVSGYSAEEIARLHPLDFFTGDDRRRVEEKIAAVFEDGESTVEAAFLSKGGRVTPYFFTGRRIVFEGSVCLVGMGIDISERKRAEDALRASEQEQRRLARQVEWERARLLEAQGVAKVGSWETDLQTLKITWSEETYRIFEADPAGFQVTQPAFLQMVHPEDRAKVEGALVAALDGNSPCTIEHRIVMPDGRVKIIDEHWEIFRDDLGNPVRALGTCQDITQRKEAEQALQDYARRLQAVSRQVLDIQENERRLLARELHDTVGQELTALGLNLDIVRSSIPAEVGALIGDRLEDSEKLLQDTVQSLRDIMGELRPPGIDELGVVAALKEHVRRVAQRSNLDIVVRGVEPQPRFPLSIAIALFRIAQEALNNTVKHAGATKVTIALQESADELRLTIADNGRGFDATRKPLIGLIGMGMTTMRERAEGIGAHLDIQSEIGKGTRVAIVVARTALPVIPVSPAREATG